MMCFAAGGSPRKAVPPARRHEGSNLDPQRLYCRKGGPAGGSSGRPGAKASCARPCCGSGKVAEIDKVRDLCLCERATRGEQAGLTRACEEEAWLPVPGCGAANSTPQPRNPVVSSVVAERSKCIRGRPSRRRWRSWKSMSWHMPSTCPGTRRCAPDGRLQQVVAVASI